MSRIEVNIDLNRVEGDLEIGLTLENNIVVDARTIGTLYRGFEQILLGRSPRDAAVITPRVCGICGTAHLYCAVLALEQIWQVQTPPNAIRIRNLCLIAEGIQSDLRQTFLYFAADLCRDRYRDQSWFPLLLSEFEPFRGRFIREALLMSRKIVEIVAIFGGQWPHSSYMLPGGVMTPADPKRILASQAILDEVLEWFERRIIGINLDTWMALDSTDTYLAQLYRPEHGGSALGLLSRACRALDLHQLGKGTPHMLSFGSWCEPENWSPNGGEHILPSGIFDADTGNFNSFDQARIEEHVRHSWFKPYPGGLHPYQGDTIPDFQPYNPPHSDRYTWSKAPRYADKVMQTGPLAEQIIAGDALLRDLNAQEGSAAWLRQFSRVRRIGIELMTAKRMLNELTAHLNEPHFINPSKSVEVDGQGCGMVMAARGALGHWVSIKEGVIDKYQIVTPTAWNASPRDSLGQMGHWEQSLIGLTVQDVNDPIEIGHIIRSHDPCLVCTVHFVASGTRLNFMP